MSDHIVTAFGVYPDIIISRGEQLRKRRKDGGS